MLTTHQSVCLWFKSHPDCAILFIGVYKTPAWYIYPFCANPNLPSFGKFLRIPTKSLCQVPWYFPDGFLRYCEVLQWFCAGFTRFLDIPQWFCIGFVRFLALWWFCAGFMSFWVSVMILCGLYWFHRVFIEVPQRLNEVLWGLQWFHAVFVRIFRFSNGFVSFSEVLQWFCGAFFRFHMGFAWDSHEICMGFAWVLHPSRNH